MKKSNIRVCVISFLLLLLTCAFFKTSAHADEAYYHSLTFYDKDESTVLAGPYTTERSSTPLHFCDFYDPDNADLYGSSAHDLRKIVNGYSVTGWHMYMRTKGEEEYTYKGQMDYSAIMINKSLSLSKYDFKFVAVYSSSPVEFPINYVVNGGSLPSSAAQSITVAKDVTLSKPTRKGCLFEGWYYNSKFSAGYEVSKISRTVCNTLDYNDDFSLPSITVYAKWKSIKPSTPVIKSVENSAKGKISIKINTPSSTPEGYELQYATDKNFKSNLHTEDLAPATKFVARSLTKGKKYFVRIRAYNTDSTKNKCYSSYSAVKSVKITKGEDEVSPKPSSAKLKSVKVSGSKTKVVTVTATVAKRVKSSDDFYYLVKVDPITGKYASKVTSVAKNSSLSIKVPLTSGGTNLYAAKLAIAVKTGSDKYTLISSASYIDNPSSAATYTAAYPTSSSKKGRQGIYSKDDGDKQYFNNLNINSIISTKAEGGQAFKYNGKTYYFKFSNQGLDNSIAYVNKDGGTVTLQVMLAYDSRCKNLIKSTARSNTTKNYYAFNIEEAAARNQIEAAFYALVQHYSQASLHVDNWILGNEVNTFKNPVGYYWAGSVSNDQFIANYAQTFRIFYYAVKSNSKNARVFTCVDHTFNDRDYDWGVKNFTVAFNKAVKALNSNIQWNLAYHAYSAVLTNADFWNDNTSSLYRTSNDYATDFVSPLNLEVLVSFVRENFGKKVHIILSEQAFSSTGGTNAPVNGGRAAGEDVQAAAVTYLFYKVMFNDNIDAVIYSHPLDNLGAGMDFALKPEAYNAYKYMDTPTYGKYTTKCIATISRTGSNKATSWKNLVPSFDDSVLKKMPSRQ